MAVFRLTPVAEACDAESWSASKVREPCFVRAPSPEAARAAVASAFLNIVDDAREIRLKQSPWLDPVCTRCEPTADEQSGLVDGFVVTLGGLRVVV